MQKKELQDFEYAQFKEFIYEIYLRNLDEPDSNIVEIQRELVHDNFKSEQLDKIFDDTVNFPFDVELFNHLIGMKLSPENIEKTSKEFEISMDLLIDKIKEYTLYPIDNINGLGLIDKAYIFRLSRLFAKQKEEKNNKSVDF